MFSFLYLKEMLRLIDYLNLCFKNVFEEKIFFCLVTVRRSLKRFGSHNVLKNVVLEEDSHTQR